MNTAPPAGLSFHPGEVIDHPSGYLALSARNRRFMIPGAPGFIAYRVRGRHLVSLGGVHAPEEVRGVLLDGFLAEARRRLRRVLAVQVRADQVQLFRTRGFTVNPLGSTYAVRLQGFSFAGTRRMKLRQKIQRARRAGLRVVEVGQEVPADQGTFDRLARISTAWLQAKGKKELDFMVGELGGPADPQRRIFITTDPAGREIGFITYVPVWGRRPGYLHDLTRRLRQAAPGAMELCNAQAMARFAGEGAEYLHFGFTPFAVGGAEGPAANRILAWVLRMLWQHGERIYPARSQVQYKLKWAPEVVETEFIACRPLSVRAALDLLLLTRSL